MLLFFVKAPCSWEIIVGRIPGSLLVKILDIIFVFKLQRLIGQFSTLPILAIRVLVQDISKLLPWTKIVDSLDHVHFDNIPALHIENPIKINHKNLKLVLNSSEKNMTSSLQCASGSLNEKVAGNLDLPTVSAKNIFENLNLVRESATFIYMKGKAIGIDLFFLETHSISFCQGKMGDQTRNSFSSLSSEPYAAVEKCLS